MQSYNHPAWQYPRPPHHSASFDAPSVPLDAPPTRSRHTSFSHVPHHAPQTSHSIQPSVPLSLTPGRQSARIWDKSVAQPNSTYSPMASPYQSPQQSSLYNDYFFSHPLPPRPAPPIPRKPKALVNPLPTPPPIPPKPPALTFGPAPRHPLYPTSIPMPVASLPPRPQEHIVRHSSLDEKQIELVVALSTSEARKREEALMAQEEDDLARALEESRLLNSPYPLDDEPPPSTTSRRPPSIDRASTSAIKASAHPPEGESWLHLITPTASTSSQFSSMTDDLVSPLSAVDTSEVDEVSVDHSRPITSDVQNLQLIRDTSTVTPPLYANVVSNLVRISHPPSSSSRPTITPSLSSAGSTTTYPQGDYTLPSSDRASVSSAQSCSNEHSPMPSFSTKPSWTSATSETSASAGRSLGSEFTSSISGHRSPSQAPSSPNLSLESTASLEPLSEDSEEGLDTEAGPSSRPVAPLSANQYVEPEMLFGISLGFHPPVISTELTPVASVMPNVITLPYGKAPLFHFQAPSWRGLLKLLARLSATRLEPTIDALSVAKHELRLRTVIQFVKVHHSANEWRTILYFSTDHPVPQNTYNPHKYTNGDVGVLPFSYTLSPLPTLLRDSAESAMAKYYVVPSTPSTPYPNLPIDFPNLAMYLQSAVQDSRRAASDSSSGLRKLAQYIDACFPNEAETSAPTDQTVSRRVGGMFKRVIGRNKASNRNSRGNEEIYDLVTPFVPDEWG